ncbi:neuropilin-1a isoform X1 [Lates japonicus]|uniref:Neuropilin-1a isoform X1 n=1 Tax=Lates japonicus TaxID=270547 RepID=A0AAD3MJL6_LATJO|nr:neuropilin-1a isoform X1 [Lates japonicus]
MHCGLVFILFMGILLVVKAFKNDKCGGNIRISTANYLTSPGYPMSYPPSQRCVWVISAPGPHQRILINFNPHFDLEDRECNVPLPLPLRSPDELPPWSCLACWEGKHSLLCTLYNRHPAPPGIPDWAWTPVMTNRSLGRGSGVLPYSRSIVGSFFVMWNPTNLAHMVIAHNKKSHLFLGIGPYIGRYCGQNTPGRIISYTGILALTINTDSAIAKEGFSANFTVVERTVPEDFDCSDPLGMESGEITSDQIMASSQYNPSWSPERSRLNYYENAWTPAEDSNKEWIQSVKRLEPCTLAVVRQGTLSHQFASQWEVERLVVFQLGRMRFWCSCSGSACNPIRLSAGRDVGMKATAETAVRCLDPATRDGDGESKSASGRHNASGFSDDLEYREMLSSVSFSVKVNLRAGRLFNYHCSIAVDVRTTPLPRFFAELNRLFTDDTRSMFWCSSLTDVENEEDDDEDGFR